MLGTGQLVEEVLVVAIGEREELGDVLGPNRLSSSRSS